VKRDPGPHLLKSFPAVADSVPLARHAVSSFAAGAGATRQQLEAIRLATSEAISNVVLHAYEGRRGRVYVTAVVAADEFWVLIADDGRGLHAHGETAGLGVGLSLIASATDELSVVKRASGGTEVRMRFSLARSGSAPDDQPRGSVASATAPA
jgi:anti-sigma regulatory factor (Ser/Thr protein kinase)